MNEFVKAADGEKGRTEVETEVKEEDQEQESKAQGSNPKLPRCNEGGDEEVPTRGEFVIGKGNDGGAEVSQDNDHCQEAEKIEADVIEKVFEAMKMSVNNGREADSDEIDKIYPTNQAKKAEGKVKTEEEEEAKRIEGGEEIIKVSEKAVDEENKENTDELEGVRGIDKTKESRKNENSKIVEKEENGTMEMSIKAVELTEEEKSKENLNGTAEVKEAKLLEETEGDLEKKELNEKKSAADTKEVVIASIENIEKVESVEEFTERDDVEIKSDETTRVQPKEEELEENSEHEAGGNCKEMEVFQIGNEKKGKKSSIGVVWTKAVEEEEPKEEEPEIETGHGYEDVEVEETSADGRKMEIKEDEIIDQTQSQEIEPGSEKVVDNEADEVPEFELKEEEEDKFQELEMEGQSKKDVRSHSAVNEEECVNKETIEQQECKINNTTENFMLPEEVQIVERVVNTTEEAGAESNANFV